MLRREVEVPGQLDAAVDLDQPLRVLEHVADAAAARFRRVLLAPGQTFCTQVGSSSADVSNMSTASL